VRVPESRGVVRFLGANGRPIGDAGDSVVTTPGAADLRTLLQTTEPINADSAIACDGGQRLDLGYIISGLLAPASCAASPPRTRHQAGPAHRPSRGG
jgi:hypothetical protein